MRSIRRILVAVKDPAARTTPAVHKGAQLARALGARLELFHALTAPIYAETYIYSDRSFKDTQKVLQDQALRRLQALAGRLEGRGRQRRLQISVAVEWDTPAYEAIVRRASVAKADLIVAERHAGRHIAPSLLHLNDWELLRLSPVPVLLVKKSGVYDHPVMLAAIDPAHSLEKPARLDGEILQVSGIVAEALGGRLHAVHAYVPVPSGRGINDALDAETAASINARTAAAARARFERVLDGSKIARTRRHLVSLPPVDAIEEVARSVRSDIVVMGAVSRSGLSRVFIGNTAESLLDRLSSDLLIVKPPRFKVHVARTPTGARLVPAMPMMP